MQDTECVAFLQWALPRLGFRWAGFRKVRRQVCKRVSRRMAALGLDGVKAYRGYLERTPAEWPVLDTLTHITISRFYRDRAVYDRLGADIFPKLAHRRRGGVVRVWSAGCASGEEPYTVTILWRRGGTGRPPLRLVATDADPAMIARARIGCYARGSLRDVPGDWPAKAFERSDDRYCVRPVYREGVSFIQQDARTQAPEGTFDLVLCRNLAFTYFDGPLQRRVLARILSRLAPDGYFLLGRHEKLPEARVLAPIVGCPEILCRTDAMFMTDQVP
jgi:chemotaxis protein methyltransferase CheR